MTRQTPRRRTAALAIVGALLVACTGEDDTADSTTTTTTERVNPTVVTSSTVPRDLGDDYALALADPTIDVAGLVVVGSDAARYLELRRTSSALLATDLTADLGGPAPAICDPAGCAVLDDLVVDDTGTLVSSLSVDGRPVAGRISGVGTVADADGVISRVRVAYATNAGQVVVVLSTSNTTDFEIELFGFAAVYQPTAGGGGAESVGSWGDAVIPTGGSSVSMIVFETPDLGGRIGLRGLRSDGLDVVLEIPVPAPGP